MSKRAVVGRGREEQRREVESWRASGQSGAAYARSRGYSYSSLTRWASNVNRAEQTVGVPLVRLEVEKRSSEVTVVVGSFRVAVGRGFDAALLQEVLVTLKEIDG